MQDRNRIDALDQLAVCEALSQGQVSVRQIFLLYVA